MKVPHSDFGGAAVAQFICDRASCRKTITLKWTGRDGEYCSLDCMNAVEKLGEAMTTTEDGNTATATSPAPIVAGKTKKKTAPAAKAVPVKKAAAPAKKAAPVAKKAAAPVKKAAPVKTTAKKEEEDGAVRSGSNMEILLKLTGKAKGITMPELIEETGWESGMISRTLSNLKHKGIEVTKDDNGRYHSAT